jgi:hypothetical protein
MRFNWLPRDVASAVGIIFLPLTATESMDLLSAKSSAIGWRNQRQIDMQELQRSATGALKQSCGEFLPTAWGARLVQ